MEQSELDEVNVRREITIAKLNNGFNASVSATVGFNQTASGIGAGVSEPDGPPVADARRVRSRWCNGAPAARTSKPPRPTIGASATNNKTRRDQIAEDARFSVLQLSQAQRNVVLSAKADTVSIKQFEVARNRYTTGKISNTDLYNAQSDKDNSLIAHVQALRNYWIAYYHLRRATLYDFATKLELADERVR